MKRIILPFLSALILLSSCNATDDLSEKDTVTSEFLAPAPQSDFQYRISNDEVNISNYIGEAAKVVIPETIEGVKIKTVNMKLLTNTPIKELTLPSGIEYITGSIRSETLEVLNIPASCKIMGSIFQYSTGLREINVEEGEFKSIDGVLYSADGKTLVCYPMGRTEKSFTVPSGVETIGRSAFYNSSLTEIILPEGLSDIDDRAFACCEKLEYVSIPKSLKSIGVSAFEETGLSEISLPEGLTEINSYAFRASQLNELYLPASLQKAGFKIADENVQISGSLPIEGLEYLISEANVEWRDESELECAIRKAGAFNLERGRVFTDLNGDGFPEMIKCYSDYYDFNVFSYDRENQVWDIAISSGWDWYNAYYDYYYRCEWCKRIDEQTGYYEFISNILTYEYTDNNGEYFVYKYQTYVSSDMTINTLTNDEELIDVTGLERLCIEDYIEACNPDINQSFIIITDKYNEKAAITVNGKKASEYPYADMYYPDDINIIIDGKDILRGDEIEGVYYSNGTLYLENVNISSDKIGVVKVTGLNSLNISLKGESSIECTDPWLEALEREDSRFKVFNVGITDITFMGDGSIELTSYDGNNLNISENAAVKVKGSVRINYDHYSKLTVSDNGRMECNYVSAYDLTVKDSGYFCTNCVHILEVLNLCDNAILDIKRNGSGNAISKNLYVPNTYFYLSGNSKANISNISEEAIACDYISVSENAVLTVEGKEDNLIDCDYLTVCDNGVVTVNGRKNAELIGYIQVCEEFSLPSCY